MDIQKFYADLEVAKKKPKLIIGETKTPVAEYDIFSHSIIINKNKVANFQDFHLKFLICHELGHYLNLPIVLLFKIIGVLTIISPIFIFTWGLWIMSNFYFILGIGFWLVGFLMARWIFNFFNDYNEYVADRYAVIKNNITSEDYRIIMKEMISQHTTEKTRNTRRINRSYKWLKNKGL